MAVLDSYWAIANTVEIIYNRFGVAIFFLQNIYFYSAQNYILTR